MALTRIWCLKKRTQDATIATFVDETVYGAPEVNRNQEAHFIVIAKINENQVPVFMTGIDNSNPLNELEYEVTQSVDGGYRLFEFIPPAYNPATTYTTQVTVNGIVTVYAAIVWHVGTGRFYRALGTSFSGIEPGIATGWETYWKMDPDFTLEIANNKTNTFIYDDIITFRYDKCLADSLAEISDDILCGVCSKTEEMFETLSMQLLLDGANSYNWQQKVPQADLIITQATKKFCC